jgi:uncharacterized membrane protein YeaQ/YmgE (transglycosylase-associated protein family)
LRKSEIAEFSEAIARARRARDLIRTTEPNGSASFGRGGGMVSLDQFVVWLIIGLIGGSVAGLIIRRERKGLGLLRNLALGLVGAFVGGLLFRLLGLFRELDKVMISLRDVVAAVVGSLLVLAALWLWQRWHSSI